MAVRQVERDTEIHELVDKLEQLQRFDGPPGDFWPAFLEKSTRRAGARLGLLLATLSPEILIEIVEDRGSPGEAGLIVFVPHCDSSD